MVFITLALGPRHNCFEIYLRKSSVLSIYKLYVRIARTRYNSSSDISSAVSYSFRNNKINEIVHLLPTDVPLVRQERRLSTPVTWVRISRVREEFVGGQRQCLVVGCSYFLHRYSTIIPLIIVIMWCYGGCLYDTSKATLRRKKSTVTACHSYRKTLGRITQSRLTRH